jgi:hypothetical protein
MPNVRLIDKSEIHPRIRRRSGEHVREEQAQARSWLVQARDTGQALELVLAANERDETVKARYRIIAREENLKIRFQTGTTRAYTNRKGRAEQEAESIVVQIISPG